MQAITIKYLPATNTKGSRGKATAEAGSVTVSYDHEFTVEGNVKAAVRALVKKLAWNRADVWYIGALRTGIGLRSAPLIPAPRKSQ